MKNIDTLLKCGNIRGEEAGRIMLRNEAAEYRREVLGDKNTTVFTESQIRRMIDGIPNSVEGRAYNLFVRGFSLIRNLTLEYLTVKQSFDHKVALYFHLTQDLRRAENVYDTCASQPVIMTRKQFSQAVATGDVTEKYPHGIAVLEEAVSPDYYVDEAGDFEATGTAYRFHEMAESVFERYAEMGPALCQKMRDGLAYLLPRRKAVELIVEYLRVPEMAVFIPPEPDLDILEFANETAWFFRKFGFYRYGLEPDEKTPEDLKRLARRVFQKVDVAGCYPSAEAVEAAGSLVGEAVESEDAANLLAALTPAG